MSTDFGTAVRTWRERLTPEAARCRAGWRSSRPRWSPICARPPPITRPTPGCARFVADLRTHSERFAELWDAGVVGRHASGHKTIVHPSVGEIVLDCDVLTVPGAGHLRIVAYTAEPGSEAAGKLALVKVIGAQALT